MSNTKTIRKNSEMLFIGQNAPNFIAPALMLDNSIKEFNLGDYIRNSYAVLFFYNMDFSYVCPTELVAIQNRIAKFKARNTKVVAISVDSYLSHLSWKKIAVEEGGLGQIGFPIVADISREVSKKYDVLYHDSLSLRGTFIIDNKGIIRYQAIYDLNVGRNTDEILRVVDALQLTQETGDLCPVNWTKGKPTIRSSPESIATYMKENNFNL